MERIMSLGVTSYVADSDEDVFKMGTRFKSFHY